MKLLIDGTANMDVDLEARTGLAARKMLRLGGWSEVILGDTLLDDTPVESVLRWALTNNCRPDRITLAGCRNHTRIAITLIYQGYSCRDTRTFVLEGLTDERSNSKA